MPGCSHRGARNPSRRLHAPHRQSEATPLRSRTDLNDAGRRYGKLRIKRERTRTPPSTLSACHTRATCQGAHGVATVTHGQVGADNQERRSRRSAPRLSARTSKLVMRVRFPSPALLFSSWSETFFGVRFRPLCGVFRPGVPHGSRGSCALLSTFRRFGWLFLGAPARRGRTCQTRRHNRRAWHRGGSAGGLPRTRRRSIHARRNLSRAPAASLRDRRRRTEPACREVRQQPGSGEGSG